MNKITFTEGAADELSERLAAYENMRAVANNVVKFGEALIHREYEPLSPTVVAIVNHAREAVGAFDSLDREKPNPQPQIPLAPRDHEMSPDDDAPLDRGQP